jgi:hypothetical protein
LDIMNVARSIGAVRQLGGTFLGIIPNGDREWKGYTRDFANMNTKYRVLPPVPDMDSLANSAWVSKLCIPRRALPTLNTICDTVGIQSRSPLVADLEDNKKTMLDVRVPLFTNPDENLTLEQ